MEQGETCPIVKDVEATASDISVLSVDGVVEKIMSSYNKHVDENIRPTHSAVRTFIKSNPDIYSILKNTTNTITILKQREHAMSKIYNYCKKHDQYSKLSNTMLLMLSGIVTSGLTSEQRTYFKPLRVGVIGMVYSKLVELRVKMSSSQ